MKDEDSNYIRKWYKTIQWSKRPKAVCKPCWEIRYCPYGPLVEEFPLKEIPDEKSCRIFGHDCPVFTVTEPFTETRELRNISRQIPRVTQFRVLKRENQICCDCGKAVKDEEVEFDHIIPWSKGGSSDESNIRLLCTSCNRKKGMRFEDSHLVRNVNDHLTEPDNETVILMLTIPVSFAHDWLSDNNTDPTAQDFADYLVEGDVTIVEELAAEYFKNLKDFFNAKRPNELSVRQFDALKFRWGFRDGIVYKIKKAVKELNIGEDEYFDAEKNLIQRLGIRMDESKKVTSKWKRL